MKHGLGLVLLAGCNLYFGSSHGYDDTPPPVYPDAHGWRPDSAWVDAGVRPDAEVIPDGLLPVAPSAGEFMWQGLQEHFKANGVDCHGQVTMAVSDHAVCYVGTDDDVHCVGSTYTEHYGSWAGLGKPGVDQILLTMTYNTADGNSICLHERTGKIECFGTNNDWGNFGNGTMTSTTVWTTYGAGHVWKRMTSFAQETCAIDDANDVYCAGYMYGATPVKVGTGSSVYLSYDGMVHIDDASVLRAGSSSSYCVVDASGLLCSGGTVTGVPGHVVDGTVMNGMGPQCNLDDAGRVHCSVQEITEQQFSARPNVALAGSLYTDTHCAVGNDGSLWCRSSNHTGELGTTTVSPYTDTQIRPPGSVKITCN